MTDADPTLRPATLADADAVRALTRAAYARWVPVIGREPRPMTADYHAAIRGHRIDLLYLTGRLAALIETIMHPDHLLIENIAVAPEFQHRGLGRRLLGHAEHLAIAQGHTLLRLYTNRQFTENVRLYHRFGYTTDREEASHLGITVYLSKRVG
jgi:ribosomal protein S18 acetylase RimI-like enzyme